jgi:hypothetical protein
MRHRIVTTIIAIGFLAGCGTAATPPVSSPIAVASPTQQIAPSSTPLATPTLLAEAPTPTSAPIVPTATTAPTAAATATATPTPIAPSATTTAPTATATPQPAAQPRAIVVVRGRTLAAIDDKGGTSEVPIEAIDLRALQVAASPDGVWIAGPTGDTGLTLYNREIGDEQVIPEPGLVNDLRFAPDSSALIYTVRQYNNGTWSLKFLDLATGQVRLLREGRDKLLAPIAWSPSGVLLTEIWFMGSDAPPTGLYLLNPADGTAQTIRTADDPYVTALPSPDGTQIAIVEGLVAMGIENPTMGLTLYTVATGERRELEPTQPGYIFDLRWSPDSTKLIYNRQIGQTPPSSTYTIADLTGEPSQIDLGISRQQIRDFQWKNNQTLALLVEEGAQDKLYELPIADPGAVQQIAAIEGGEFGSSSIVYLER